MAIGSTLLGLGAFSLLPIVMAATKGTGKEKSAKKKPAKKKPTSKKPTVRKSLKAKKRVGASISTSLKVIDRTVTEIRERNGDVPPARSFSLMNGVKRLERNPSRTDPVFARIVAQGAQVGQIHGAIKTQLVQEIHRRI